VDKLSQVYVLVNNLRDFQSRKPLISTNSRCIINFLS